jgi:hypothetical protein
VPVGGSSAELLGSALVTLVGIGLTTFGAFTHTATAMAPGAALAFLGGGWLGNALARRRPIGAVDAN